MKEQNNFTELVESANKKRTNILLKNALVGIVTGLVVVLYRYVLGLMEEWCLGIYDFFRTASPWMLILLFGGLIGISFFVAFLVKYQKMIKGSGIPQVKGLMLGHFDYSWFSTLWAKFVGGATCVLSGLSLGREGPSIQLGACVGQGISEKLAKSNSERKTMIASGASAGLAAAFNAPLAGVMFSLEEIYKYFSPTILLSTLVSVFCADLVSKLVFGMNPVFHFTTESVLPLSSYGLLLILGAVLGLFGAFYNATVKYTQKLYAKIKGSKKFLIPFICAGVLGLVFPLALCGGHSILAELTLETGIWMLVLIFVIKFVFSMISFCSGAPGGIFFPLLIMGCSIGAIFASIAIKCFGFPEAYFFNFVILAMGGCFTAIVRAPITGIILIVEMTGSLSHLLSLTFVSLVAYVVAELLKSTPIYDYLLDNLIENHEPVKNSGEKTTIELIVQHDSTMANLTLSEITLPENCLLASVRREGHEILPSADLLLMPGDYLVFLVDIAEEALVREALAPLTECP